MRNKITALYTMFIICMGVGILLAQAPRVQVVDSANVSIPPSTTTEIAHDAALGTLTSVKGLLEFCRAKTAAPSAVSAEDDGTLGWCNLLGARAIFPTAHSAGGALTCYLTSAATTNSTNCKASAGTIYDLSVVNTTATLYYLRLYNSSSAPTCSSSTNFVESIPVPAATAGAGIVKTFPVGREYTTGIGFCYTLNGTNNDNNAAVTGSYISIGYK